MVLLIQFQSVANSQLVVFVQIVLLVQALQLNTILLSDRIHALSVLNNMWTTLVFLWSLRTLFLQPDNLAWNQTVFATSLVVFSKFAIRNTNLLCNALPCITLSSVQIIVLVIYMYRVQTSSNSCRLISGIVLSHKSVVILSRVIFIQSVKLNNLNQLLGISWVGGISTSLQTISPTLIVGAAQSEQTRIA